MKIHMDGSSNVTLVTSPYFLYDGKQTSDKMGNAGGVTAKATHVGDLNMLLESSNRQILLIMKLSCKIPANNHRTSGLFPFLAHGSEIVSHAIHESFNVDIDDNNNVKTPAALTRFFRFH